MTLGCSLLALVSALVYAILYVGTTEFNLFALLLAFACCASGALVFTRGRALAGYLQFWCAVAACMFFIYGVYYYISVVLVGIDLHSFSPQFILCAILFSVTMIATIVNLFVKRVDAEEN